MLLLVTLSTVAILCDLDIVLGAFAAGFVLHLALPEGDQQLEAKLTGLAFGLLIPVFGAVTSGISQQPLRAVNHWTRS